MFIRAIIKHSIHDRGVNTKFNSDWRSVKDFFKGLNLLFENAGG